MMPGAPSRRSGAGTAGAAARSQWCHMCPCANPWRQDRTVGRGMATTSPASLILACIRAGRPRQMARDAGAASVLSGGLRFSLAGAGMAGIGAAIAGLVVAHGIATQEAHSVGFFRRQLRRHRCQFQHPARPQPGASAGYSLSSVESASYGSSPAAAICAEWVACRTSLQCLRLQPGLRHGPERWRFFRRCAASASPSTRPATRSLRSWPKASRSGGNVAQAQLAMAAVQQFATSMARQTPTMPNVEAFAGGISSLTRLKLPGLTRRAPVRC